MKTKNLLLLTTLIILSTNSNLFSKNNYKNTTNNSFYEWNKPNLLKQLENISKEEKNFDSLFILTKIYFRLAFIEYETNQRNFTKKVRNEDENNPGYLNLALINGEKAYKIKDDNFELNYYLAKSCLYLICNAETYMKYNGKRKKYSKQNRKMDKENIYTLLIDTYFHALYDEQAGADRVKGEKNIAKLLKLYSDDEKTYSLLSLIYFERSEFKKALTFCQKGLNINPNNLEIKNRLNFLLFLNKNPKIENIQIKETGGINKKILENFIKIKSNDTLDLKKIKKIIDRMEDHRYINNVEIYYTKQADNKISIELFVKTDTDTIMNICTGYELVIDKKNMADYAHYIKTITPPIFYFNKQNLFKKGVSDFTLITAAGMLWDLKFNNTIHEYFDINVGFDTWVVPLINVIEDYSDGKEYKSELPFINIRPQLEIGKKIKAIETSIFFRYSPDFTIIMPPEYNFTKIENKSDYTYPPLFFVEHNLNLSIVVDNIALMEFGKVRKGYKFKLEADWFKNTPDIEWGYKNYMNNPTNLCFLFHFYAEYSNFINDIFYFSFGLHYKGGVNLYKKKLVILSKGFIGTPFDETIKIHGFGINDFQASQVFLLNSLFGFKVNSYFHLGLYIDLCNFFEENPKTYLTTISNTNLGNNLIAGFGTFFKWSPGWMFDILFEASFGYEAGSNKIYGPVFGIYLQKIFINPKIKKNKKIKFDFLS